ncbi:GNAT family N-acetyltransferase [Halalkalibacillus sediminis]|uniref:GNAT family N-acetyltransferase n=1 Tax=Halalkalibacillus sediminis TaxID=2018042 RepID=A0A2I0QTM3_9BACI|nr:GNAT family N-acetyltransferase [Halalkalibacillus sediminis]PKR77693.1 GNAT family N-acetyltransferase [Halalkalibacillus sediminis]
MNIHQDGNEFYYGDQDDKKAEIHFVERDEDHLEIDHTYVAEELRNQAIGQALVEKVVHYAREVDKKIIATCPYAKMQLEKNEDYHDVISLDGVEGAE